MSAYRLPPRFYTDHVERGLPGGSIVRSTSRYLLVELSLEERAELLADARFYADDGADVWPGLIASARATVAALERQP